MPKKSSNRNLYLLLLAFLAVLLIIIISIVTGNYYLPRRDSTQTPPNGNITIQGEIVCLPPKSENRKNPECAFGIVDAKGNYYSLRDNYPRRGNNSMKYPPNTTVVVVGYFTPKTDGVYQRIGSISIDSLTLSSRQKLKRS